MVAFYVLRIKKGIQTLDSVPSRWHDSVKAQLIADGFMTDDTTTTTP